MPMFLTAWTGDYIAGTDLLFPAFPALDPTATGRDNQVLPEWVRMPCRAGARLEGYQSSRDTRGLVCLKKRVDANIAGEILFRALRRRL